MSDVWAHCPECDRWFYPDEAVAAVDVLQGSASMVAAPDGTRLNSTAAEHDARCPVCSVPADRLEDRADGGAPGSAQLAAPTVS